MVAVVAIQTAHLRYLAKFSDENIMRTHMDACQAGTDVSLFSKANFSKAKLPAMLPAAREVDVRPDLK